MPSLFAGAVGITVGLFWINYLCKARDTQENWSCVRPYSGHAFKPANAGADRNAVRRHPRARHLHGRVAGDSRLLP